MQTAASSSSFPSRLLRAARLEGALYEEVEHDRSATPQAVYVVAGTSLLAGIGSGVALGPVGLIVVTLAGLIGWAFYAWITYLLGVHVLAGAETRADWGQLARCLGFASTPRGLLVLGVVPVLAGIISLVVFVWMLFTTIVALRAALDVGTGRAVATAIAGWLAQAIVFGVAFTLAAE